MLKRQTVLTIAVLFAATALGFSAGCSKKKKKKTTPTAGKTKSRTRKIPRARRVRIVTKGKVRLLKCSKPSGGRVVRYDLDRDRKVRVDMWKVYRGDGTLACREMDLNFDGKRDQVVQYYANGKDPMKLWQDQDFDGKFELVMYVRPDSTLSRVEMDTDSDGRLDLWKVYRLNSDKNNKVFRVMRDRDNDGYKDYWERYDENGNIEEVSWTDKGAKDEKPRYWLSRPAPLPAETAKEPTKEPATGTGKAKKGKPEERGED